MYCDQQHLQMPGAYLVGTRPGNIWVATRPESLHFSAIIASWSNKGEHLGWFLDPSHLLLYQPVKKSSRFPHLREQKSMNVCVCVRNPESKGKAGGPWTHRWHGPTKTHLCRRENVPASEMARWPSQKPPKPTWHDTTWHDGYHFISFHPLHYGVYQSVSFMHPDLWLSAGKAWWFVHRGYQVTRINPDIMLPEASSAQASRVRTSIQKTPSGDWMLSRINPEPMPE